jgi:hypothetical protein
VRVISDLTEIKSQTLILTQFPQKLAALKQRWYKTDTHQAIIENPNEVVKVANSYGIFIYYTERTEFH